MSETVKKVCGVCGKEVEEKIFIDADDSDMVWYKHVPTKSLKKGYYCRECAKPYYNIQINMF